MKRSTGLIYLFVLLCLVGGCSQVRKFSEQSVIGVWIESDSKKLNFVPDKKPCFEFLENGEFRAYNYPEAVLFEGGSPVSQPLNGYGKWSFEKEDAPLGNATIRLEFGPNPNSKFPKGFGAALYATSIQIESVDRLFSWVEADSIIYLKKDSQKKSCK